MITMTPLLAAILATVVCAGVTLTLIGLTPAPSKPAPAKTSSLITGLRALRTSWSAPGRRAQLLIAAVAGPLAWLTTGLPVAAPAVMAAVLGVPLLLTRSTDGGVARLEALEEWTRALSGVLAVGVGIEQAITATRSVTNPSIAGPVNMLAARLSARWDTTAALRAFADDLGDGAGDMVAGALILGVQRRGTGLADVLEGLAVTVADEVQARRSIEADRAKPRTVARAVTILTLIVLAVELARPSFRAGYDTTIGQLLLALWLTLYGLALVAMKTMTRVKPAPRFLTRMTDREQTTTPAPATAPPASRAPLPRQSPSRISR